MYRYDPLLGRVRLCRGCDEEWPFDAEFWHLRDGVLNKAWPSRCRACCAEYFAARRRLTMTVERTARISLAPAPGRCAAPMRAGARCGRNPGHRFGHRSVEAMRYDASRRSARAAA